MWFLRKKQQLGLLGPDPTDIRDFQLAAIQPTIAKLPSVFNLRSCMTSVQSQHWGTCTSHMGDAIAEYWNTIEFKKTIKLSQKFIYYNTKVESGLWTTEGDYLRYALKAICKWGAPLDVDWPDIRRSSWKDYIKDKPPVEIYEKAKKYLGKTYWSAGIGLDVFRQAIYQNKVPIGFGMLWYESYKNISSDGCLPLPSGNAIGGHAITGVGWDQNERFWVKNSWGENWGNSGYFHLPFEEFSKHTIWNAYVMLDIVKPKILEGWVAGKYLKHIGSKFRAKDQITPTHRLNLRDKPGLDSKRIKLLEPDSVLEIIEGGTKKGKYIWWKVKQIK